jgi:hypothetical protein
MTLVEPALANDAGHYPVDVLTRPFFLAEFGERQLTAENLHADKKRFEREYQSRAIEFRKQQVLNVCKRDAVPHKIVARAIGRDDVKPAVQLAAHLISEGGAYGDHVEPGVVFLRILRHERFKARVSEKARWA